MVFVVGKLGRTGQPSGKPYVGLGLFKTSGGREILKISAEGFQVPQLGLPIKINDKPFQIPQIGTGVCSLGNHLPRELTLEVRGDRCVIKAENVERLGQIGTITESLMISGRRVAITPLEVWGGQIRCSALSDKWKLLGDNMAPIYTHMPYTQEFLGLATDLLPFGSLDKVIGVMIEEQVRAALPSEISHYWYLYLNQTASGKKVRSRDVYLAMLAGFIKDLRSGNLDNPFDDKLLPPDIALNADKVFLTGNVLKVPDIEFQKLIDMANDPKGYFLILPPAQRNGLREEMIKAGINPGPDHIVGENGYQIVLSPGLNSWMIGGALYAKSKKLAKANEPVFVITVEKDGISSGLVCEGEIISGEKFIDFPESFRLNSQLPPDLGSQEKDIHRITLINCIAEAIRKNTTLSGSQAVRVVSLVIPGRIVEVEPQTWAVIEGSDFPNWALRGGELTKEVLDRSGFQGKIVLVNDAVASAVYAVNSSPEYAGKKMLMVGLSGGVGAAVVHFLDEAYPGYANNYSV